MLFRRRHKPTLRSRIRTLLWPRSGWRRTYWYVVHRVRRLPGTPYVIAAGFASGAAISMTPFPGFHFLLAGLLAWTVRGSIIASAIGTFVGNPWTFPFIWLWIYESGAWILGVQGQLDRSHISIGFLIHHPLEILLPMIAGGLPTAAVVWVIFFFIVRRMVASYQEHRRHKLARCAVLRREEAHARHEVHPRHEEPVGGSE